MKRQAIHTSYAKLLAVAQKQGFITNMQACIIGGFSQGYYHLRKLEQRGLLLHNGYNKWASTKRWNSKPRRWKCPACGLIPKSYTDCDCLI